MCRSDHAPALTLQSKGEGCELLQWGAEDPLLMQASRTSERRSRLTATLEGSLFIHCKWF